PQFGEKLFGGPVKFEKKILQTGIVAADAQNIAGAEDFGDAAGDVDDLILADEGVELQGEVRLGREGASDSKRKAVLNPGTAKAARRGEGDVIDFRIAAPSAAAGDRHLELARKIVKVAIAAEGTVHGKGPRRSVKVFVVGQAGDGASSDCTHNVSACPG